MRHFEKFIKATPDVCTTNSTTHRAPDYLHDTKGGQEPTAAMLKLNPLGSDRGCEVLSHA